MYTKHYFDLCTIHVYIGFLNRVQSCVLARDLIPKIYNKEFEIEIMNNVRICQFWELGRNGFFKRYNFGFDSPKCFFKEEYEWT